MLRLAAVAVLAVLSSACGGGDEPGAVRNVREDRPFSRVLTTSHGERPPARDLAPPTAEVEMKRLPASGGVAEQIFVQWWRVSLTGDWRRDEQGVLLWQADHGSRAITWRVVYGRRYPPYLTVRYQLGDVTRDGHADVLVDATMGSAGCGWRRMVASVGIDVREVLSRYACELGMWIGTKRVRAESGDLVIREPVGGCPYPDPSAHCFGGFRTVTKRWNGSRLATVDSSVECVLPRLDPRGACRPRQQ